jgi:hypothetical protein
MTSLNRLFKGAVAGVAAALTAGSLYAQLPSHLRDFPLADLKSKGDLVAPYFDGWIRNEDGSVTMIFGFMNRNREEVVDVPLGPNNYIEPAQFDGVQPTHFPIYDRGGFRGIRERGAFAVTVPADMKGTEVVWTLKHAGKSYSIPGRATSASYEMSYAERALGSLGPAIRFDVNGEESVTREGIYAPRVMATVGKPVTLSAFAQDRGVRENYEVERLIYPVGTEWIHHQGPREPSFETAAITGRERDEQGEEGDSDGWTVVQTQATFWEPGEYVVRLRVDNFAAPDSGFDYQCCWSNAYVPVTVEP